MSVARGGVGGFDPADALTTQRIAGHQSHEDGTPNGTSVGQTSETKQKR
jgi:hypothetical protein